MKIEPTKTWLTLTSTGIILTVVIGFALAAKAVVDKVDQTADRVGIVEDTQKDLLSDHQKFSEAVIGINTKLEILLPGYKK